METPDYSNARLEYEKYLEIVPGEPFSEISHARKGFWYRLAEVYSDYCSNRSAGIEEAYRLRRWPTPTPDDEKREIIRIIELLESRPIA